MFRFKPGLVLAIVVVTVLIITITAPAVLDWLDPQIGSYSMVVVALVAGGVWWVKRRSR